MSLFDRLAGDLLLSADPTWTFAVNSGRRTLADGTPVQRYRKELIRVGDYVKKDQGIRFSITRAVLDHWADTFQRMKANGVKVSIPNMHKGEGDPDKNRGYVEDLYRDEDSFVMICDLIGDDAIAAASRCDVSITVPPDFTDGKGNTYVRPIRNVVLCTDPVVPGLGAFEPIAASHTGDSDMDWTAVQKKLGMTGELTDATAVEEIGKAFDKRTTLVLSEVQKALGGDDTCVKLSLDTIGDALQGVVEKIEERGKKKAAADKTTVTIDPQIIKLSRESRDMKLDALVTKGRITPAVKKGLATLLLSDESLKLAFNNGRGTDDIDALVTVLNDNDPVVLQEQTKAQTLALSDPLKDDADQKALVTGAKARADAAKKRDPSTMTVGASF